MGPPPPDEAPLSSPSWVITVGILSFLLILAGGLFTVFLLVDAAVSSPWLAAGLDLVGASGVIVLARAWLQRIDGWLLAAHRGWRARRTSAQALPPPAEVPVPSSSSVGIEGSAAPVGVRTWSAEEPDPEGLP